MSQSPYESEDILQRLLAEHPELLAGDLENEETPARWLLIDREVDVPDASGAAGRWSLDHLFLDSRGTPTLVEVKRSNDTRIRREVVGQMLDYAANAVVYWPPESLRERFEARCEAAAIDPDQLVRDLIGAAPEQDEELIGFWEAVRTNLQAGKVRMVFVADEIPPELRRVIEFLNGQMSPAEVIGIEVRQFVGDGMQTLVPRVLGQTEAARQRKGVGSGGAKRQWDERSFFEDLGRRAGPESVRVARRLLDLAQAKFSRVWWGQGAKDGSFVPILEIPGSSLKGIVFTVWTYGRVELTFQYMLGRPYFDDRTHRFELLKKLRAISGFQFSDDAVDRRPTVPLQALADEHVGRHFSEVVAWAVDRLLGKEPPAHP
jgi:hypothetical protein